MVDELKNKGINENNIVFISFEDPDYNSVDNSEELDKIVYDYVKDISGKIYLFFDEIQEVTNWEKSINGFRFKLDCDIYITGSNSKLLSNELSTLISGIAPTACVNTFFIGWTLASSSVISPRLTKSST